MAKAATGAPPTRTADGWWSTRVTIEGRQRVSLRMPPQLREDEAEERARDLAAMALRLRKAGMVADAPVALKLASEALPGDAWANAAKAIDILCAGTSRPVDTSGVPTFATWAERWTSGELARTYPDVVNAKTTNDRDEQRFRLYVNDVIGPYRIDRLTLDKFDEVVAALPQNLRPKTRQQVKQAMATLMGYAVYPGRYIDHNPIPRRWVRTKDKPRAKAYLYPQEDAQLLGCKLVPVRDRLVYGFLQREGCRRSEALDLLWADLDLDVGSLDSDVGSIRLDENKTDSPRAWALDPGTVRALRAWRDRYHPDAELKERVFLDENGTLTESNQLRPENLRAALRKAGITRPELTEKSDKRQPIRVHDLRAGFVTTALANGKTEAWVMDRTGHTTSAMLNEYRRAARTHAELNLGGWVPLDEAIPELRTERAGDDDSGGDGEGEPGEPAGAIAQPIAQPVEETACFLATPRGLEPRLPA